MKRNRLLPINNNDTDGCLIGSILLIAILCLIINIIMTHPILILVATFAIILFKVHEDFLHKK